jgi:hypothetical protein
MDTSEEFIEYCYNSILGRSSDPDGKRHHINMLKRGVSRHEIMQSFLNSEEYAKYKETLMNPFVTFAPPGHFYSPLPDIHGLERVYVKVVSKHIQGININEEKQIDLLKELSEYYPKLPFGDGSRKNNTRYFFNGNESYSYGDAIILFCMINYIRPRRFIEVGSGYSSVVTLDACEMLGSGTKITLIEPYPNRLLGLLSKKDDSKELLISKCIQDVDLSLFDELDEGDILFIDSSHVVKFASDVLFIFADVLPRLKPGVIVHFHDIFWPFEYPLEWLQEGRAWNEAYFLRVFLMNNKSYEILYFNDFMGQTHGDLLRKYIPLSTKNAGGGFWMKKLQTT